MTYNSANDIVALLDSLPSATDTEIDAVLVDNSSDDDTVEVVSTTHPWVRIIESSDNRGFAAACNLGAVAPGGYEHLVFVNPDCVLDAGSIDVALGYLRRDQSLGAVGGRTRYSDGTVNITCCFARPTLWSAVCYATGLASLFRGSSVFNPEQMGGWDRADTREVDVVTGCFLAMRGRDFAALGGFDERFFMYSEDTDLSIRLAEMGKRCIHAHDVGLIHTGGGSDTVKSEKLTKVFRARSQYYDKHWSPRSAGLGRTLISLAVLLRLVAATVGAPGRRKRWSEVWRSRSAWNGGPETTLAQTGRDDIEEAGSAITPAVHVASKPVDTRARIEYRVLRHIQRSARRRDFDFVGQGLQTAAAVPWLWARDLGAHDNHECNVCGWVGRRFYPNTGPGYHEKDVTCPGCSSLDRHRSLLALLLTRTTMFEPGTRVVEVAPMRGFETLLRAQPGLDYVSFDLERYAMERGDITAMRYPTGSVDYFICFHVLEHIPDATAALAEIHRVLKVGGTAVLQVPIDWNADGTREYDAPDPRDVGHVRQYGRSFPEVIAKAGFEVVSHSTADVLPAATVRRFGLSPEPVFFATKTTQ